MSFVRFGRQQHTKGKRPVRPKKTAAPQREWVSTVNDLSVHKLTAAEMSHRHEIHKSHNKVAAQWELREKALKSRLRHSGNPAPLDQASLSIIREVFSDQLLLQDVLDRSDRAMAVVKDLFGDAPRRQTGHPSVTMAPNCDSYSALPVLQRPDPPTQLSLLSQSMMDQQALNELESSEKDHSEEDTRPTSSSDCIRRANVRKMKTRTQNRQVQQQKVHHPHTDDVPVTPCTSGRAPDQTALNATVAVQRVRSRRSQGAKEEPSVMVSQVLNPELSLNHSVRINNCSTRNRCVSQSSELDGSSVASLSGDQSSLGLLRSMLDQVEADLDALKPETARASAQSPKQQRTQGLTGFSVALVSTLGRLVHLVKQREEEVQNESQERRRLEEELREHRGLIDALTAETLSLREEAAALQEELQQRTAELEQTLDTVVLAIGGLGHLGGHIYPPQKSDIKAAVCQSAAVPERTPASPSSAVLLSPPQQKDHWQQIPVTHLAPLLQERPAVDFLRSREPDLKIHGSASSLTSLPLTSLPSTTSLSLTSDPLGLRLSPEVMLAEIAELNRQNELIKAQLRQAKSPGLAGGGSPNSSEEQRRSSSSSSSSGRVTPQSVSERRTSVSRGTDRQSPKIQAAEVDPTSQVTSHDALSVNSVEQRLLMLNRQSAAARGRLLELIEQQKQSAAAKVSHSVSPIPPSVSPIPPSTLGQHTADGEGSPEVSLLNPSQQPLFKPERRTAGSEASVSPSFVQEARDGNTQVNKQKEREGWFSLSAHVR